MPDRHELLDLMRAQDIYDQLNPPPAPGPTIRELRELVDEARRESRARRLEERLARGANRLAWAAAIVVGAVDVAIVVTYFA